MARSAARGDHEIHVRPAQGGDASDVAALLEILGYPCTRDEAADRIGVIVRDPRHHLLIAEIDGATCGLVSMDLFYSLARGADIGRVTALAVSPDRGRHGVGRRLLRAAERIALRAGASRLEVTSNATRTEAHAFYRGCGFSEGSLHFVKPLGD